MQTTIYFSSCKRGFENVFQVYFSLVFHHTLLCISSIRNVAFFFSAISTSERNEVRTKEDKIEEESDSENDDISCTAVSQEEIGSSTVKKYFPAISYWIALTTPNGAPANPIIVHRALLSHGVKVVAHQVGNYDVHVFTIFNDVAELG